MKALLCICFMTMLHFSAQAQRSSLPDSILLKKSKDQKLAGYITMGCGIATFLPGVVLLANEEPGLSSVNWNNVLGGIALVGVGVTCITASIVLFSASNRNERKAYSGLTFHVNKPVLINTGLQKKYLPYSVSMSIPIK